MNYYDSCMEIKKILDNIHILPADSFEKVLEYVTEIEYPKGTHLYREHRRGERIFFIKQGLARAYAQKGGKEVTFWLGKEGDILFPLQTMQTGATEYASVELLEDSVIYTVDMARMESLFTSDIHICNWGRKYAEYTCIRSEKIFISRLFKSSQKKYEELMSEHPDIIRRVPLGIIASFLGMSQVNLSRIRARIR